jgi:Na+-driven multidrug efflux pump
VTVSVVLRAGWSVEPPIVTTDRVVADLVAIAWPWFATGQPAAAAVVALAGVLVGAADRGFLRGVAIVAGLAGFLPVVWISDASGPVS